MHHSRLESIEQSVDDVNTRLSESTQSARANLEESVQRIQAGLDQLTENLHSTVDEGLMTLTQTVGSQRSRLSNAESQVSATAKRVDEIAEDVSQRGDAQDEITSKIQFLQKRAQAIAKTHDQHANQIGEQLDLARRRLDQNAAEIEQLRSTVLSNSEASAEHRSELDGKITQLVEERRTLIGTLDEVTTALDGRIGQQHSSIEAHSERIEQTAGIVAENAKITHTNATSIAEALRSIGEVDERASSTREELQATDRRIDSLASRADATDEQIIATRAEVDTASEQIESLTGRADRVDELLAGTQDELERVVGTHASQVEAVANRAASLDERFLEIDGQTSELKERNVETEARLANHEDKTHSLLEEQRLETEARLEELNELIASRERSERASPAPMPRVLDGELEELSPRVGVHDQQIEAINDWVADVDTRVSKIGEQRNTAEEGLEALNDWTTVLDQRVIGLQADGVETNEKLVEITGWIEGLDTRSNAAHTEIEELRRQAVGTSRDIEDLRASNAGALAKIDATNERAASIESHNAEMDSRLDQAHRSLTELADAVRVEGESRVGLAGQVQELVAAIEDLQRKDAESQNAHASLQSQMAAAPQTNEELRDFMVYRIDMAEDRIDRRLSDIEQSGTGTERIDSIEQKVIEADDRARDAHAFSENLRLLQTDLVQAIQADIASQASRIAELEALLANRT